MRKGAISLAAISISDQLFASVNDTNNTSVVNGGAGILGLGFPTERCKDISLVQMNHLPNILNSYFLQQAFVSQVCSS
jgi:energy-converting hydrogenase Eha subunit C